VLDLQSVYTEVNSSVSKVDSTKSIQNPRARKQHAILLVIVIYLQNLRLAQTLNLLPEYKSVELSSNEIGKGEYPDVSRV
jgi:hypothetical protein